ncbi:MAG: methylenetetrahydrofolate--tRNA-(uracil(54)-C(5))-methyltransferase (FADH(2)-oxidizing) TrmFO [Eubacteriales bacterium]|nr:methylenetetrahydrofolate--tRNA-(uracil(54)-C(5))-methyltransferase (FADH(2)-oxidizing) TrmFO [Eubacteriales bacterium]
MAKICVLGAGLAGSEAAWQLARRGLPVDLIDMKPGNLSPAHEQGNFAELVCSNSLRSEKLTTASGLLKLELKHFHSLIMEAAEACRLPAGNALAVDREAFPRYVTEKLKAEPLIRLLEAKIDNLEELSQEYQIIATGPLTAGGLFASLQAVSGLDNLFFFDAAAPLVETDSIDFSKVYRANRYEEGGGDYLNCPLTEEQYRIFYQALLEADRAELAGFERQLLFEGCKPVEELARDGYDTLRFGPLKPVGLPDPRTGKEPYAVVQLRQDNFAQELWNMVGFQTRLKFPEQTRVFQLIPGLEQARFARFGVMHRNSFLNSPRLLGDFFRSKAQPKRFFAGQLTGVEGYLESTASGLVAALALADDLDRSSEVQKLQERTTVLAGLAAYVSQSNADNFQPMKANFSLLRPLEGQEIKSYKQKYDLKIRGRALRRTVYSLRSLETLAWSPADIHSLLASENN